MAKETTQVTETETTQAPLDPKKQNLINLLHTVAVLPVTEPPVHDALLDPNSTTPLSEKLDHLQKTIEHLEGNDRTDLAESVKEAAYHAFKSEILDHNLSHPDQRLEFITDAKHAEKVDHLNTVLDFLNQKDNKEKLQQSATEAPKSYAAYFGGELKSSLAGIGGELYGTTKDIGIALNEFRKAPFEYPILKTVDARVGQALDRARLYLKSDPSQRNLQNRVKQATGGLLNVSAWVAKQCVNVIRKPIAFTANVVSLVDQAVAWPYHAITGNTAARKSCEKFMYQDATNALRDLRQSIVAGGTLFAAVAMSPFAGPAAAAVAGVGIVGAGMATGIAAAAHLSALTMTHAGMAAQTGETMLKGAYLHAEYSRTGGYTEPERKALHDLYHLAVNHGNTEALDHLNKLEEHLKGDQLKQGGTVGKMIHSINQHAASLFGSEKTSTPPATPTTPAVKQQKSKGAGLEV